jgi:hypothetical protein
MPTKSWKSISKFRLFTIVGFSLLTSLSLSISDELWTVKEIVTAILQAGIAAFAYLQCPTIRQAAAPENKEC